MTADRIESLKQQIADLKRRWPAHSPPPAMMEQLDELEEALARELASQTGLGGDKRVMRKSGQALVSGKLAREYGFTDLNGTQPVWLY